MYTTSHDAETAQLKFEAELREASHNYGIVEQQMNELRRKALELTLEKDGLREPLRKARENIRRLESELRTAKIEFFRLNREGL